MAVKRRKRKAKTVSPCVREVQRLTEFLLRDMRPEALAVKANVTVYTVYRWSKGATAAHQRHLETLRRLVLAEKIRRGVGNREPATPGAS